MDQKSEFFLYSNHKYKVRNFKIWRAPAGSNPIWWTTLAHPSFRAAYLIRIKFPYRFKVNNYVCLLEMNLP